MSARDTLALLMLMHSGNGSMPSCVKSCPEQDSEPKINNVTSNYTTNSPNHQTAIVI